MKSTEEYLQEIKDEVKRIREIKNDYEAAHGAEDSLFESVLRDIAKGKCPDPVAAAREALRTKLIDFPRNTA